ncbi:RDD family protein [Psychromonas hadalis]|uniref:RDD family protein n=1 Tax=Psychromonas hadalis TaxID=211669 RepID=UPI0006883610
MFPIYILGGYLLVNGYLLHNYGQTIGKSLLDIAIVSNDGENLGLVKIIFKRWLPIILLSLIPIVGSLLVLACFLLIFRMDKKCVHDHIAGTKVISVAKPTEENTFKPKGVDSFKIG